MKNALINLACRLPARRQKEDNAITIKLAEVDIVVDELLKQELATGIHLAKADWVAEKIYYWGLKDLDNGQWVAKFSRSFEPMALKPGTYKITYWQKEHGSKKFTLVDSFELLKGQLAEIEL